MGIHSEPLEPFEFNGMDLLRVFTPRQISMLHYVLAEALHRDSDGCLDDFINCLDALVNERRDCDVHKVTAIRSGQTALHLDTPARPLEEWERSDSLLVEWKPF